MHKFLPKTILSCVSYGRRGHNSDRRLPVLWLAIDTVHTWAAAFGIPCTAALWLHAHSSYTRSHTQHHDGSPDLSSDISTLWHVAPADSSGTAFRRTHACSSHTDADSSRLTENWNGWMEERNRWLIYLLSLMDRCTWGKSIPIEIQCRNDATIVQWVWPWIASQLFPLCDEIPRLARMMRINRLNCMIRTGTRLFTHSFFLWINKEFIQYDTIRLKINVFIRWKKTHSLI